MARKNGLTGAIPGAGRPQKKYVKRTVNLSPEAAKVLSEQPFGSGGDFVSKAIMAFSNSIQR